MRVPLLVIACLASFVILSGIPSAAQSQRPFTFEDMMKLKRVAEPIPSPDGKWIIFSVVDVDLAANKKTPHIWIVSTKVDNQPEGAEASPSAKKSSAGTERMLIAAQDGDRPRWSPDGKRFAFLSNKGGSSQVWIADFNGTTGTVTGIRKLTSIATEASGELWSPDGSNILFTSDVYPECDGPASEEQTCNAKKLNEIEDSKVKAIIFEQLLYRHWNAYRAGRRSHLFLQPVAAPKAGKAQSTKSLPIDLTPGDYEAPVFSLGGQDDYAFSPDGKEVCYTSNHDKLAAASTNNDLWLVPTTWDADTKPVAILAQTKDITSDNPASDSTPLYSPDGHYIAYRAQKRPGDESDRFRLMLYDRSTGEKKNLTEEFDGWVNSFAWSPTGHGIVFTSEEKGESSLFLLFLFDHAPQKGTAPVLSERPRIAVAARGFFDSPVLTSPNTIYLDEMSISYPNEIVCVGLDVGGAGAPAAEVPGVSRVTHLNDALLAQIDMAPLEPFAFTGAHGDRVQGFLIKPPNFDPTKKYPVKFLIHGGPEGAWGDDWSFRWNPELFAADGYVVIMINFHGSTGYGQRFIDAINGDWGGAPFEDLMKGLDYAEQTYSYIDKDRECALGASYGGFMANWVLGHTDRFKCIVSHDGMFNTISAWGTTEELWFNNWEFKGTPYTNPEMYEKWNPRNSAKNFKTPTLVVHGQLDYRLDVSEGLQLFTTLQVMGIPSKMLYFPDEGHWVLKPKNSQLWYKTVNDWVDQWTKK